MADAKRSLNVEQAQEIYRQAIDARASDREGDGWWSEVRSELVRVLAARTVGEAAAVIAWWYHDWAMVGDSPVAAAKRLRKVAERVR